MTDPQKFLDQPLSAHIANVGTYEQIVDVQEKAVSEIEKFMRNLLPGFAFIVITLTPPRPDGKGNATMTKNLSLADTIGNLAHQIQVHAKGLFRDIEIRE